MHSSHKVPILLAFAALSVICSGSAAAQFAESSNRAQSWEWYGEARLVFSKDINFEHGSSVSTSTDAGFGLGFGYNIDEHWLASFEYTYNNLSYSARIASADTPPKSTVNLSGDAEVSRVGASIAYNFLARSLTPYVLGSLGWSFVDSNIPNGPPQTGCWWDPWWGYVCSTWQSTASSTSFTYGLGAGIRWDAGHSFFTRLGYEYDWLDLPNSNSSPGFSQLRLQFGTRF